MLIRHFQPDDRDACLAIFHSNAPLFSPAVAASEFAAFLDDLPGPFFVVSARGEIVACGGYAAGCGDEHAHLTWGMVRRDHQGKGLARLLLLYRLEELAQRYPGSLVTLDSSLYALDFFRNMGFTVERMHPAGCEPGRARFDMTLRLDDAAGQGIRWQYVRARRYLDTVVRVPAGVAENH